MDILYLLIPLAVLLAGFILWALFWAIRTGQFDDLERPGHEIFWNESADPPHVLPPPCKPMRAGHGRKK